MAWACLSPPPPSRSDFPLPLSSSLLRLGSAFDPRSSVFRLHGPDTRLPAHALPTCQINYVLIFDIHPGSAITPGGLFLAAAVYFLVVFACFTGYCAAMRP